MYKDIMAEYNTFIGINPGSGDMWDGKLDEIFRRYKGRAKLKISEDINEAKRHYCNVIEEGYPLVVFLGGDGTQQSAHTGLIKEATRQKKKMPIQIITDINGTGKLAASYVGASGRGFDVLDKLVEMKEPNKIPTVKVPMLKVSLDDEEILGFCYGQGIDAKIVNKYDLGESKGLWGYVKAGLKVLWENTGIESPHVRITSVGGEVTNIENGIWTKREYKSGELIYEGKSIDTVASGIENFGFDTKAFPEANAASESRRMHLRIVKLDTAGEVFRKLVLKRGHQLRLGNLRAPFIKDYLVPGFEIRILEDRMEDIQVGGDFKDKKNHAKVEVTEPILAANFWKF
jgi:diacylglycerol kinase family enzyme